ncbi:MAG: preprotein translocase subunit YajC [Candidatus Aureabacteria bacterium]|nr:preprotein translocase subunit YajC [Candidatus Auribacterota bacterium]
MAGTSTAGQSGSLSQTLLMVGVLFAIFYFLLIRPQKKQQEKHKQMIESLKKGDKIITSGGIYGVVANVKDKTFIVKVDDNTKIEVAKSCVSTILVKKDQPASSEEDSEKGKE